MNRSITRVLACPQQDASLIFADLQQPPALAPELARAVADLAFASEVRA